MSISNWRGKPLTMSSVMLGRDATIKNNFFICSKIIFKKILYMSSGGTL